MTIPAAGSLACRFSVPFPARGAGRVVARVQAPDGDEPSSSSSSSRASSVAGRGGGETASAPASFSFGAAPPLVEQGECAVVSDGFSHPNGRLVAPVAVSRPPAAGAARRVCSALGQTVRYRAYFSARGLGDGGGGGGGGEATGSVVGGAGGVGGTGTCGEFSALLTARANPATGEQPTSTARVPVRVKVLCPGEAAA